MITKKESERHKLLKEYGKLLLTRVFGVPEEHIYAEFAIGSIIFDVIAYPLVEIKQVKIIAIECGNKKSNILDNYNHFKNALKFVDLVIWIPYNIFLAPYSDLIHSKIKDIIFIQVSLEIFDTKFSNISNLNKEDTMYALYITKQGRFPFLEKDVIRLSEWKFD